MFDERADGNAGKEVIATAKREYDQAKAELSRLNNSIRDFESGKVKGTEAIDFQIIPFKASKENKVQYEKAVADFGNGKPIEQIWAETGFFLRQNTNDKTWEWAYRIDQNKMEVSLPENLKAGDKFVLGDVVNYPEFFNIFPKAKETNVVIENIPNNEVPMRVSADGQTITLNKAYYDKDTENQRKSDFAHEIQHFIQTETEQGGGANTSKERSVALRSLSIQADSGRRLILNNLTDAQIQDISRKVEESEQTINYLRGDDNIPPYLKDRINKEIYQNYSSHIGEREARLATTDFTKSPYQTYNEDAEKLGIAKVDFEAETKNLRSQDANSQISDKQFTPITQKAYNALVTKLSDKFKRFGGKLLTDKVVI